MDAAAHPARIVVTGILPSGKEGVISDEPSSVRVDMVMGSTIDLWSVESVPAPSGQLAPARDDFVLNPPPAGLVVRLGVLAPDEDWKDGDLEEAFEALNASDSHDSGAEVAALHATPTVDVATVAVGEVVAVLESEEVTLRAGDTLIQRGTKHAWNNRSGSPATIVFTQISTAG